MKLFTLLLILFSSSLFAAGAGEQTLFDILHNLQSRGNYGNSSMTNAQKINFIDGPNSLTLGPVKKTFWIAADRHRPPFFNPYMNPSDEGFTGITPAKMNEHFYDLAYQLVTSGLAKRKHFKDVYLVKYQVLLDLTSSQIPTVNEDFSLDNLKDWWWAKYRSVFVNYLDAIIADPQPCAGEGVLAGKRMCCNINSSGLLKLPFIKKTNPQCLPVNGACGAHMECCSGVCKRDNTQQLGLCASPTAKSTGEECDVDEECLSGICTVDFGETKGQCESPMQCYSLISLSGDCGSNPNRPYCGEGQCYNIDKGSLGGNLCKRDGDTCSSNNDCCSDRCNIATGKCIQNSICKKCVGTGATPAQGEECCPGYYLNKSVTPNKCRHIYNPHVPTCKFKNGPCQNNDDCCSGQCGAGNKCTFIDQDKKDPKSHKGLKKMLRKSLLTIAYVVIETLIPSAHAETCANGTPLTPAQQQILEDMRSACNQGGQGEMEECMRGVEEQKAIMCRDSNTGLTDEQQAEIDQMIQKCIADYPDPAQADQRKDCIANVNKLAAQYQEQGANGSNENRFEDYINQYNAPPVTAKTYSNIRTCDFYSFNDTWKDASNTERNAELFTRSFEYVFAGTGTQDYWADGDKGNVFTRSHKIAVRLREERTRLINLYKEVDRKAECYCIGVFGPDKFPQAKQDKFNSEVCSDIRVTLQGIMNRDGESPDSKIDGTVITGVNNEVQDQANMETVDKGALGWSYTMALIQYTNLRRDVAVERFTESEDIAAELTDMSEFLINTNFTESWKPEVRGTGKSATIWKHPDDKTPTMLNTSGNTSVSPDLINSPNNYVLMYKWGFRYWNTFMSILIVVFTGVLGLIGGNLFQSGQSASSQSFNRAGLAAAFGPSGKQWPSVYDKMTYDNDEWNRGWGKKWDGFERYYLGPEYKNNSTDPATTCHILARASSCLRVAYLFRPGNLQYLEGFPDDKHFLIDPKLPPFLAANTIETVNMPGTGKNWVRIVNETVDKGVRFLATQTHPRASRMDERNVKSKDRFPGYHVTRGGSKYRETNVMDIAFSEGHFLPFGVDYTAPPITSDFKSKVVNAAKKYAMCKELTDNALCAGVPEVKAGEVGFGYLFENEQEAYAWAQYTYELHYVYSSVTLNEYMGYPLLGQNYYFEAMAAKINLLQNIYMQRAQELAELGELYNDHLQMLMRDYSSLGELINGIRSKNIKYNPKVFEAFQQLNFMGMSNIEVFDQAVANAQQSNAFSQAELGAINAARSNALRTNKALKHLDDFSKTTGKLKGALDVSSLDTNQKKLVNPIGAIMAANPGKFGNGFLNSKLDEINKKLANIDNTISKKPKPYVPSFTAPEIPSYGGGGYSASTPSSNESASGTNQSMSTSEADKLIKQLNSNKELTERLEGDTLFTIVSKAYKRNYSRVLYRTSKKDKQLKVKEVKDVTNEEKEELKKLLQTE